MFSFDDGSSVYRIKILSIYFRAQPGVGMESEDSGGGTGDTSTYQV